MAVSPLLVLVLLASPAYPQSLPPDGPADPTPVTDAAQKIDPLLQAELQSAQAGQMVTAIVTLKEQVDLRGIDSSGRADRQETVIRALLAKANASQSSLRALLQTRRSQGSVSQITPFWVFNGLAVTATPDVIRELASRSDVLKITPNEIQIVPVSPSADAPPEPNLTVINAPALWALGFRGQGVVVASMDTGVDYAHPDLAGQWRGGSNSWYDPYGQHPTTPIDLSLGLSGHGTWTMGVLVGGDAGGTAIGVAPEAQWVAAKIFNDQGSATASAIHLAFQWLLDPDGNPATADAPQVVNNSWAFASPGCDLSFEPDLQSLVAAGITPVFAAGNDGPNPSTSASPGNNPSAFAVGATNNSDVIAGLSSRGPTSCGGDASRTYPAVTAPGVNIRSADLFSLYVSQTGTSIAAPHVTGALALLLSAFPNLSVDQQRAELSATAVDLGPVGPDDIYGDGRIDVLAAYNSLTSDTDGDGFQKARELYVGTDALDACPNNPTHAAWPLDINNDATLTVTADVLSYRGRIGAGPGDANWWQPLDLDENGAITVTGDILLYRGRIGESCT